MDKVGDMMKSAQASLTGATGGSMDSDSASAAGKVPSDDVPIPETFAPDVNVSTDDIGTTSASADLKEGMEGACVCVPKARYCRLRVVCGYCVGSTLLARSCACLAKPQCTQPSHSAALSARHAKSPNDDRTQGIGS